MFPDLKYLSPKLNLHHLSVHYFEFILFYGFSLPCWFGVSRCVFNFFKAWISWTDRTISWQVYISELAFKLNVKLILPLHALLIVGVFLQSAFIHSKQPIWRLWLTLDVTSLRLTRLLCVLGVPITVCTAAQRLTDHQTTLLVCYFPPFLLYVLWFASIHFL